MFVDIDAGTPGAVANVEASVRKRMDRAQYLHDLGKTFEFVIAESALRFAVADPSVMIAQLDRLLSVAALPNVERFGIIPQMRRIHTVPQTGFMLYDDMAVLESPLREQSHYDDEARVFAEAFERHWADAVEGSEARELIRGIMEEYATA